IYVQDKAGTIYGPFEPESGTIPFGTYRRWRKTGHDTRVEKIEQMASELSIPRASMVRDRRAEEERNRVFEVRSVPFVNPIGLLPENYASQKEARRGLFLQFGIPLGSLPDAVLEAIETILQETLNRREVYRRVKELFQEQNIGG